MKRAIMWTGLAAGVIGTGVWARRRFAPDAKLALTTEPPQVPLMVPGRVAVERVMGAADPSSELPLVVALHGVSADEAQLAPFILTDQPVRVVLLRGGLASGRGFQWIKARYKDPPAVFLEQVAQGAADVPVRRRAGDGQAVRGGGVHRSLHLGLARRPRTQRHRPHHRPGAPGRPAPAERGGTAPVGPRAARAAGAGAVDPERGLR